MSLRYYANAPATTLTSGCSAVSTSITVDSTAGLPIQYPYTLLIDRGTASEEAVSVTAAAGSDLTVERGLDGTTAFVHSAGAVVEHGITAQDVREPNAHVNADNGVHGVTGDVVGTTDTQTLTDKTLTLGNNTVTGTKAQFNTALTDANFVTSEDLPGSVSATTVTFATNAATAGEGTQLWKSGGIVTMAFYMTVSTTFSSGVTLFTVPVGFRPPRMWRGVGNISDGSERRVALGSSGTFVTEGWDFLSGVVLYGHMTWPAAT